MEATDLINRTLGAKLNVLWGQPLVVDNRPGGHLVIGTEHVVRADPDGYTFLATVSSMTSNVSLLKLPYDTLRDLAPVTLTSYARILLVKLLALTGYKRSPFFPDTPTLEEQGITGFGADWSGVFAPAGTPEAILTRLAKDIATVVAMPDVDAWYRNQAQEPVSNTPAPPAISLRPRRNFP